MNKETTTPNLDPVLDQMTKVFANKVRTSDFGIVLSANEQCEFARFASHDELDSVLKQKTKSEFYIAFYRNHAGKYNFVFNGPKSYGSGSLINGKPKFIKFNFVE